MESTEEKLRKVLFCGFVLAIFMKMFFFTPYLPWLPKFVLFNVPAFTYPGSDARNIQMAAHCARAGFPYFGPNACMDAAEPVRAAHPEATVPVLNYPSHWVRVYGLFKDDSEQFFIGFLRLNALLLVLGTAILCYRYNLVALPLLVFSPVALLAVERGNNDATTFFFTFVPLLAFASSPRLQSFFVGFAAALKVFPAAGWLAFARTRRPPFATADAFIGAACAAPLVVLSFLEIPHFLAGTARGFWASYGLPSLRHAPALVDHGLLGGLLTAGFIAALLVTVAVLLRGGRAREAIERDLARLAPVDQTVLLVSAAIFVVTFLLFTNWAYRLIFLIPAFLVLSKAASGFGKLVCLNILAILWMPFAGDGWLYLNFACYPLAILLAGLLAVALDARTRPDRAV